MKVTTCFRLVGIGLAATLLAVAIAPSAVLSAPLYAEPLAGWVVHNQNGLAPGVANANTNSPTFTTSGLAGTTNGIAVMANFTGMFPFGDEVTLHKDGDYIKATTTLSILNREVSGVQTLNQNLRIGLFNGPSGSVGGVPTPDFPNQGITAEYCNGLSPAVAAILTEQRSPTQLNPFTSGTSLGAGTGGMDVGGHSISGTNIPVAYFELKLTRNAGNLDITGVITDNGNYTQSFSFLGYAPQAPNLMGGDFTFNRMGFLLNNNVRGEATLGDVIIETNVPEPGTALLALTGLLAGVAGRRRLSNAAGTCALTSHGS